MDLVDLISGNAPVTYLHIPKCGGTTFIESLMRTRRLHRQYANWQELDQAPTDELTECDLVSGHFYNFQLDRSGLPSTLVTVMRDPLERTMSAYAFARSQSAEFGTLDTPQRYATSVSFKEYFYSRFGVAERHVALYMLGLKRDDYADIVPLETLFERSLQELQKYHVLSTPDLDRHISGDTSIRRNATPVMFRGTFDLSDYEIAAMRDVLQWDFRLFAEAFRL